MDLCLYDVEAGNEMKDKKVQPFMTNRIGKAKNKLKSPQDLDMDNDIVEDLFLSEGQADPEPKDRLMLA